MISQRWLGGAVVVASMSFFTSSAKADEECTTHVSRGVYLARAGLLVEAREALLAAGDECDPAREHAADLAWRIPKVFLHVSGLRADEVTMLVDGNAIDRRDAMNAQRLNPGEHVFVARTSDGGERHTKFVLAEGETRSITIEFFAGTIVAASPSSATSKNADGPLSPLVYAGFGVGALGLALGIGGAVAGANQWSNVKSQCVDSRCPPSVADDLDSSQRWATISTVGFVTAAIGAGAGIFGLVLPRTGSTKRDTTTARVNVGPATVGVAGTF